MTAVASGKDDYLLRLRKIEGQVRGVTRMVEEDRYCIDVITQLEAVEAAIRTTALTLLQDHTEHCVASASRSGDGSGKVRELNEAIERLVRR